MSETAEEGEVYRVTYLTGVKRLEPIKHIATWKSHELFDMVSPIMKWTDCDDLTLNMARGYGMLIQFTNERPEKPTLLNWFSRIFRPRSQA